MPYSDAISKPQNNILHGTQSVTKKILSHFFASLDPKINTEMSQEWFSFATTDTNINTHTFFCSYKSDLTVHIILYFTEFSVKVIIQEWYL